MKLHLLNGSPLLVLTLAMALSACGTASDDNSEDPAAGRGDYLASSLSRDLSPEVDEATQAQLSADNRTFAFDLLEEIRAEEKAISSTRRTPSQLLLR